MTITYAELKSLKGHHDRMVGALEYVNAHPRSTLAIIARANMDIFFSNVERYVVREGENRLDKWRDRRGKA